jgi:hypothetical protein
MPLLIYLFGFAWGFVLLCCFAGWGLLVGHWLHEDDPPDWGLAVARGIALLVALGGVLNLSRLISAGLVLSLVGIGLVPVGVHARRFVLEGSRIRPRVPAIDGVSAVVAVIVLISYLNWLCFDGGPGSQAYCLNTSDDASGYLVYPLRMLQTGTIGYDPFNDRRTSSALGGESFLQTFVLAVLPVEFIHLLDPGVANLATALMLYSMTRRRVADALTVLYLSMPTDGSNASAIALPVLLLLAMYRELSRPRGGEPLIRTVVRIALQLAAVLTLKGTLIPGSVLIVAVGSVALAAETRSLRPLAIGLLAGVLASLLLLPWMIDQYPSAGTPLYPFLGEGFRATSSYSMPHKHLWRSWSALLLDTIWFLRTPRIACAVVVGIAAMWALYRGRTRPVRRSAFFGVLAGSLGTLILFLTVFNPAQFYRYIYQFLTFFILIAFGVVLERAIASRYVPHWRGLQIARAAAWGMLGFLVVLGGARARANSLGWGEATRRWLTGARVVEPSEAESYRRLQAALPPSTSLFMFTPKPFLLDFRRNTVFIYDMPGAVSPPPGLPLGGASKEVADYLHGLGIRYLAVGLPLDPKTPPREWLRDSDFWLYSLDVNTANWRRQLAALGRMHESVYRDERFVVIDLGCPRVPALDRIDPDSRATGTNILDTNILRGRGGS